MHTLRRKKEGGPGHRRPGHRTEVPIPFRDSLEFSDRDNINIGKLVCGCGEVGRQVTTVLGHVSASCAKGYGRLPQHITTTHGAMQPASTLSPLCARQREAAMYVCPTNDSSWKTVTGCPTNASHLGHIEGCTKTWTLFSCTSQRE